MMVEMDMNFQIHVHDETGEIDQQKKNAGGLGLGNFRRLGIAVAFFKKPVAQQKIQNK